MEMGKIVESIRKKEMKIEKKKRK